LTFIVGRYAAPLLRILYPLHG